jgi:uncharacterized membrane protein
MTHIPATEDYVPLLPWFGVVLIGMFIGKTLFDDRPMVWLSWNSQQPVARWLAFGGRHSIHVYILHQPVFIGVLSLWFWATG